LKYLYNPATDEFESLTPTLRDRFALGGGVIQGEKVGDRENFQSPNISGKNQYGFTMSLEDQFKVLDQLLENETKLPSKQNLTEPLGYKKTDGNVGSVEKIIKKYNEARGTNIKIDDFVTTKGALKKPTFAKVSPETRAQIVNEYVELTKGKTLQELRAGNEVVTLSRKYGPSKKKIAQYLAEAGVRDPDNFKNIKTVEGETATEKTKKTRLAKIKKGEQQLSKDELEFNKKQDKLIEKLNEDFRKNPNKVLNNPKLISLLNLKLEDGNVVSKNKTRKELIDAATRKAGLLDTEHIADVKGATKNIEFPVNRQITTYNVNSGFLVSAKNYINRPDADPEKVAKIVETLKKYGLRVKTNKDTLGAPMISAEDNIKRNLNAAGIDLPEDAPKLKPSSSIRSNVKAKITEFRNTAQSVVNKIPFKGLRMVPAAGAAAIDYGVFAGLLGTPIDEAIVGASGWLTKRPELGKALGTIATQYSEGKINLSELREKSIPILKEIGKEQLPESKLPPVAEEINEKMGEGTIKIADEVPEPESAERRRMFEEANERFNEMEISDVDDQFMAAAGGRVGFQDGTSNPIFDQVIASLDNTDLINNLEEENKQTLAEQIYGDDGDRTLMQTFNTMFADPKAYPYYAQELASGAANIPELAFRFPFAVTGLVSDVATGRGDKLKRAMETLDPKLTKAIKEKIGFTDMLEKSRTERTGPQRTTGGILELGAEIPGPATPYFLIKAFPKIANQIRNIVGSDAAARKVNEELEKRLAVETVDQTRRDILLAAGAGGAVAVLKFLGLDNLIKTTKVAKAAPEIITKGGTPKYFFDFVNLIKTKGDDITDKAATIERQKVYDYNGYTMYEDISTGKISIRKDTEGGASYYIGDGEYETVDGIIRKEEIIYDPPETIVGKDGKPQKVPDIYEENTLKPDYDGKEGDMEGGLESIDEILELLSKNGKTYSKEELLKMGIDPDLTNVATGAGTIPKDMVGQPNPFKTKKAEGGIIAGVSSGPPPKSGPTPHGLPYVAKNVRPITERK